jgi:serine/threonine protein kinase
MEIKLLKKLPNGNSIVLGEDESGNKLIGKEFGTDKAYENEKRFMDVDHPNAIKLLHAIDKEKVIFMEYAPNGNLFDFLESKKSLIAGNEKLARGFFKEII